LTLGENAADLGGVLLAYDALLQDPAGGSRAHGYDTAQQFFLAFAQSHCEVARPEVERQSLMSDPHAPAHYRVNGTLTNVPAFAAAFSCPDRAPQQAVAKVGQSCGVW
jgi:predicted metalloendopeptidase